VSFGLGDMADDFCVAGDDDLSVKDEVGGGFRFYLVVGLGFFGVETFREVDGENCAR